MATVGIPKEVKQDEDRVAIAPAGVEVLRRAGHRVLVEEGAGAGSDISDEELAAAGAELVGEPGEIYAESEVIAKVKEPLPGEYPLLREAQIIFTFFHFAASRELTEAMIDRGVTCIAYETIKDRSGRLPILTPMSEVAGRMAVFEGCKYLERPYGGRGLLLSGVPGVEPGEVVILGGGVVGANAARIAAGVGARVSILDISIDRLRQLDEIMPPNVQTVHSNPLAIREKLRRADLVISAVLVAGAKAPVLVTRAELRQMRKRSVIVDVAIDQGGSIETSRPTTHSQPTFVEEGIVHYCVANMPGAVARTSTLALTSVTLPYLKVLADGGVRGLVRMGHGAAQGLNIHAGKVYHEGVASAFHLPHIPLPEIMN